MALLSSLKSLKVASLWVADRLRLEAIFERVLDEVGNFIKLVSELAMVHVWVLVFPQEDEFECVSNNNTPSTHGPNALLL